MRAAKHLAHLVSFDTTSHRSNLPLIDELAREARSLGLGIKVDTITDAHGVQKANLICAAGPGSDGVARPRVVEAGAGGLAFVGHTDTVPFDPAWKEALTLTERDGRLYARGAADTKGFIAAVLAAVEATDLRRLRRPLTLVFTHDEEVGCLGAKRLGESNDLRPSYAIVGEPTSLVPIRGHKGYCTAEVEVVGKEGHSAYPEVGVNAIFHGARLLSRIEAEANRLRDETDPLFAPPYTTVNVGRIEGGRAKNVIPGSCRFVVEWRPIPGQPVEAVYERIAAAAESLHREDPTFECELEFTRRDRGVMTPADSPIVTFLEEATGRPAETVSFGTEAPQLTALGAETVVCGPGDIKVAHRTGEFVPVLELGRAVEIFRNAIRRFCIDG